MRRLLRRALGLAAVALILPATAAAQAPAQDSVVGSGNLPAPYTIRFEVDARSGPDGQDPAGTFTFQILDSRFQGQLVDAAVTCLAVRGTTAAVGVFGTLTRSGAIYFPELPPPPTPAAYYVFFADNGVFPGGGPEAVADAIMPRDVVADPSATTPLTDCAGAQPPAPLFPNVIGEVTVVDALAPPSLPASKDDCKRGGYERFGFPNQGRCIAFVKRLPGPP